MIRTHDSVQISDTSIVDDQSVQAQYRHYDEELSKARNTLYHLAHETNSLYLLSFNKGAFINHQLKTPLPARTSSAQTTNGSIYIVGGVSSADMKDA